MRALAIALIAVGVIGCKKKRADEEPPPATKRDAGVPAKPALPPLPPLPPATAGPVYVSLVKGGYLRFDDEGWKQFAPAIDDWRTSYQVLMLGTDGSLWGMANGALWSWAGSTATKHDVGNEFVTSGAVASDGTAWAIVQGKLQHFVDGKWVVEALPGDDPPRGVTAANEGLWVHTLDRTLRRSEGRWTVIDVPGVTGSQIDIVGIASDHVDATYLATDQGVMAYDGKAWKLVAQLPDKAAPLAVVAGPRGRFAVLSKGERYIGDTTHGVRELDVSKVSPNTEYVSIAGIDARGRVWAYYNDVIAVYDETGALLKRWSPSELPLLTEQIGSLTVGAGGPVHLDSGERMAGTVTGKVEGSAANVIVVTCAQQNTSNDKDPCADLPSARRTTTVAGGRFTLEHVSIGPTFFWIKRGGSWRPTNPVECCSQLAPDGTLDIGTLTLR